MFYHLEFDPTGRGMANSLGRNLKVGDQVVMLNGESVTIDAELFGNFSFTSGTAIGVVNGQGRHFKATGMEIDAELTLAKHGAANGWVNQEGDEEPYDAG